MKVELHLHTTRHSECAVVTPEAAMNALIERGYGAAFLTEHNEVWGHWELAELQAAYPQIRIFPGVEIALGNGRIHMLVLGTEDRSYLRMPEAADIILRARQEQHLTVLAHPFRWAEAAQVLAQPVLPDAVELWTNNHPDPSWATQSELAANRLGLRLVNSGDTHAIEMMNRYWIETFEPVEKADDIRSIILQGHYTNKRWDRLED